MYVQGSKECLENAEHLFKDATTLRQNRSFGSTQTLIVTAIEEAAKAIILELANLNYIGKDIVKQSMELHLPKKLVFLAMEKGLLFVEQIDRREGRSEVDKSRMHELENALKAGLIDMEDKRQNGFYVGVDINSGTIVNSPSNIKESEIVEFAQKAELFLRVSKSLCEFLRDYRSVGENKHTKNNLRIFQKNLEDITASYNEA